MPISAVNAALSTLISPLTGGKSTTRRIDPLGGGGTPMLRAPRSVLPAISAGVSSVTQRSADDTPAERFTDSISPSISTRAVPCASCPVTTRLTLFDMLAPDLPLGLHLRTQAGAI